MIQIIKIFYIRFHEMNKLTLLQYDQGETGYFQQHYNIADLHVQTNFQQLKGKVLI